MTAERLCIQARVWRDGEPRVCQLTGQTARTLLALVDAGQRGCTALELSSWALRLAAYAHDLRREHGIAIRTDRELHPGGWHGRYVLESPVQILLVGTGRPPRGEFCHTGTRARVRAREASGACGTADRENGV